MPIKFLTGYPALFISGKKILVISDIHIGLETDLSNAGIRIHKQIEKFFETINKLHKLTGASQLIILGDAKHKVPGMTIQEIKDIPKFFESLKTIFQKVIVTQGNHDADLHYILPEDVKLYDSKGFKIGKYGFFHGHAWPSKKLMQCDYLFMGHIQPAIQFEDKLGYRSRQQVWLKGKLKQEVIKKKYNITSTGKLNIIILPSFNPMLGSLNVMSNEEHSGSLLLNKVLDLDEMRTYLLDGTYLGVLKNIKNQF